ncbi:MAG TPA: S8 family serine peptidase [Bacteroidia bacterium]
MCFNKIKSIACLALVCLFTAQYSLFGTTTPPKKWIHGLIKVKSAEVDSLVMAEGVVITGKIGLIRTVMLDAEMVHRITKINGVIAAEISNCGFSLKPNNDKERQLTKVDWVQNGTQHSLPKSYNGKGVIVGIVDVGFQLNHPTFYSANNLQYRVTRYWEQNNFNGTPPNGYFYGTEYTDTSIIKTLNDMDGTHGTHVAGIAAGSGFGTPGLQYKGVAPESEIVLVTIKYSNDTLGGSALGDYIVANPTIIDAYKYIFDYAQSVGKPAVINLSWGMHTGPHDGTSLFDQATELLVGKGKILVGANGNEGDNPMHWYHKFNSDTVGTIMIENSRQFRQTESVYSDFWGSKNSSFSIKIKIIDTLLNQVVETPYIHSKSDTSYTFNYSADTSNFKMVFKCQKSNSENQKPNITVSVESSKQIKYAILAYLTSDSSEVHGWNSGASRAWTSGSFRNKIDRWDLSQILIPGNSDYTAGENGGTSKAVISVGALAARSSYLNIKGKWVNDSAYVIPPLAAPFSSKGPTVDGRIKPDISAPGYDVPSSINNKQLASWMLDRCLLTTVFQNDTQYWVAFNGTSMAAPHVTGIVALMLQVDPDLDAATVADYLKSTADADQSTGQVPNNKYGYGRVNAYSAVIRTLMNSDINVPLIGVQDLYPNPASDKVTLPLDAPQIQNFLMINETGQTVMNQREFEQYFVNGTLYLNHLPTGLYIISIKTDDGYKTYKLAIQ